MEEEESAKKRPLELDWGKLLPNKDDDPPALLIVKSKTPLAGDAAEAWKDSLPAMSSDRRQPERQERIEQMTDHDLDERIRSTKNSLLSQVANILKDKGEKLRNFLSQLEDERDRRKRKRVETIHLEEVDEFEKSRQTVSSSITGGSKDFRRESTTSQDKTQSIFASHFFQKMDEDTDCRTVNAFEKEMSLLSPCNHQKMRNNKESSPKRRHKGRSSARYTSLKSHSNFSPAGGKCGLSNGNRKTRASGDIGVNLYNFFEKKKEDASPVSNSNGSRSRKAQTIVLVDEEEPQLLETTQQIEKPDESMKDVKIYYPSRDDPEAVEISCEDFDCLAPQSYLTSTIMNFYIRYLQQHASPTNRVMRDCHFFNTYFYSKLKEAVSNKGSGKDNFFVKFRRWWKGVNIFHKEYVLIPINEDLHWSLVIICIPDKTEESGPIVLHLDSLGLHSSKAVFQNIKSFLKEEWRYLDLEVSRSDLPFADDIWRQLPSKIMDKTIAVPQQKNDYDCGLFVLFFMERFIEDAPGRLKKKDLAMFGKQWFKPEEASGLRTKVHKLLLKEFENAKPNCTLETSPSSPIGSSK